MRLLALALVAAATACGGSTAAPERAAPAAADVDALVAHVRAVHPDPWHDVSEEAFTAAAARLKEKLPSLGPDETLVELMRLTALLGARDGHSGIFPLDDRHRRRPTLYPVRLYAFADGVRVVGAVGAPGLVGLRLVSIGGNGVDRLAAALAPLVPADNDASRGARIWQWATVAQVLHGLGLVERPGAAVFRLARADGSILERTLAPVSASAWSAAFPDLWHPMVPQGLPRRAKPAFLARRLEPAWLSARLGGGRVVYVAYNQTLGSSTDLARQVRRLARPAKVRGIVLDLRHNPGGENAAYASLLDTLAALGRRERLVVLSSRTTFSAAANLLADLEGRVPLRLVGEPSGGSPNLVGDPSPVALAATGWSVNVGTVWWRKSRAGADDPRLAFEPDVRVPTRWADLAAGRDAALAAAVAEALG